MAVLISVLFVSFVLMFVCIFSYISNEKAIVGVAIFVFAAIGLASMVFAAYSDFVAIADAEQVIKISFEAANHRGWLYQDTETDRYFVVTSSVWDIAHPSYRLYVDDEVAKDYLESYEKFKESGLIK